MGRKEEMAVAAAPLPASVEEPPSFVTAVVCSHTEDRWPMILDAVESLRRQTRPADELLIVVDHNPALAARMRREIAGVRIVENRYTKGLSGAKNTALDAATGDIIAVLDDDASAEERWLEALVAHFDDPEVVASGSASVPRWEHQRPRWFAPELDWTVGCSYRGLPETTTSVRNVFGGAMAMRADAARKLGGFADRLGRGGNRFAGGEDTEFCLRLTTVWPDARIVYDPGTAIHHTVPAARASWSYVWRRCFGEGTSKATLARLTRAKSCGRSTTAFGTERQYVTRTIPAALRRELRRGRVDAALALVGAVAATLSGFVFGSVRERLARNA